MEKNKIKSYIICKSCGKKYDTNLSQCPDCKIKPSSEDYFYFCDICGKKIDEKDSSCLNCKRKNAKKEKIKNKKEYIEKVVKKNKKLSNWNISNFLKNGIIIFLCLVAIFFIIIIIFLWNIPNNKIENGLKITKSTIYITTEVEKTTSLQTTKNAGKSTTKKTTSSKKTNNTPHNNTLENRTTNTTESTTKKGDIQVAIYYGDRYTDFNTYYFNKGDVYILPVNTQTKSKTTNVVYQLVYNDGTLKKESYSSYTVYKANGWKSLYYEGTTPEYENNQKITINNRLILKPFFEESIECANIPTPTREGYIFKGWSVTCCDSSIYWSSNFCGTVRTDIKLYGNWEKIQ